MGEAGGGRDARGGRCGRRRPTRRSLTKCQVNAATVAMRVTKLSHSESLVGSSDAASRGGATGGERWFGAHAVDFHAMWNRALPGHGDVGCIHAIKTPGDGHIRRWTARKATDGAWGGCAEARGHRPQRARRDGD